MDWFVLTLVSFGVVTLVSSFHVPSLELLPPEQKHVPPLSDLSFQRDSVEKIPEVKTKLNDQSAFGSKSLPLREAVESLPNVIGATHQPLRDAVEAIPEEIGKRVPLRDAVEFRVAPSFGGLDRGSIWIEQLAPPAIRRIENSPSVVCHLEARAVYRTEPFALLPQAVPTHKCTHLIYSAATLDPHELVLMSRDPEYDQVKGGYRAVVGLRQKHPALRVLISITSPDHGRLYKELLHGYDCCQRFVESVLEFLEIHQFDGIEIDWEDFSGTEMRLLLRELYDTLNEKGYIIAVAIRPEDPVDPEIAKMADLLLLRAWRNNENAEVAQHPAPLNFVSDLVKKWTDNGVPASKLILGVPLYGRSYTLKFNNATDAGVPVVGPGLEGLYTKHRGTLAYYEICEKLEDLWTSGRDDEGPYLKRGDQWIGYDDPISMKIKVAYLRSVGLGGVSLWAIDLDDFQGLCGDAWPMLNAATATLGLYDVSSEKCYKEGLFGDPNSCSGYLSCIKGELYHGNCGFERFFDSAKGRCVKATPEICNPGHAEPITSIDATFNRQNQELEKLEVREIGPRVVCYVTSWALYRKGEGKFVPEHLDTRLCTDVVYAFAGLNPNTLLVQPFDPWADIDNNLYQRVTSIKGPRVILALGGWTDSSGDKYSRLVSSGSSRRKFVAATVTFLKKHNFDGLSLEWNYPQCWQSDCKKGPETDKPNFMKLILELRNEFDRQEPKLILAVAISGYKEIIDRAYELRELSDAVDYISVMSYDYHGSWESTTAHLAPLYAQSGDSHPYYNVNFTMEYLVSLGASRSKLLTGIPFYGQTYRLSEASHSDLKDPSAGPGIPGEFTRQPGMLAYYEICDRIKLQRWQTGPGPSAHYKDQWVGYEDTKSIFKKGKYILQNGFGGATAWTVDLDDFTNRCCFEPFPLLRSLNRALGRLLTAEPSSGDCQKPAEPITPRPPTLTTHGDASDGKPKPTSPMVTSEGTSWPAWTEKPSKIPESTTTPTSTTWSWTTSRRPTQSTTELSEESSTSGTFSPVPGMACSIGQYLADPSNCENYFRCVLGELKREQCAPGLHWDVKRGLCDWPSSAKCQSKTDLSPSTVKPWQPPKRTTTKPFSIFSSWNYDVTTNRPYKPTTSTTTKPIQTTEVINQCEHGQYYALPSSCTSFLVCVNGNLVAQQCGPGLNWNKEKNMCDWAYKNPCTEDPKKTAALVMSDMVTDVCIPGSYTDVEGDCESYKACLWGRHEIFQCAPGLHFNKQTRICDWPSHANCKDDNTRPSTPAPTAGTYPTRPTIKPVETITTEKPWTQGGVLPSAEVDPSKVSPLSGHFKVVCYFTNWAWYRRGVGRYIPEYIDHTLCTHIIYGFAVLDYSNLIIKAHDSWADFDNRFYERVVAYKQRGLKVLLALGGWNDSAGDKYSRLVNSPSARKKFIEHVVQFVEKFGFDGLDLDWEYPVCWQVDCKKGPESDKEGFALLLKELSSELKPRGLLLSAAVSPSKKVIDTGYDVPALAKYLDWISVMTYDFHGQWDKRTGHVAPLYYHPDDEFFYFNANYSINYWISKGAPPRNIVMGMPLYGQSFTINDPKSSTGLNSPASAGNAGEFTRAAGFLAYYEICDRIRNHGWTVVQDPQRRLGPYAYKGSQWVSFDDSDMIRQKAQYVRDMGLGGGMVWALDLDDFRGRCNEGPHPLMHTLQQVLSEPPNKHDRPIKPPFFGQELEWKLPTPPDTTAPLMTQFMDPTVKDKEEFKVICYFTNWAWYRQEGGRFVPEDIDPDLCSHVIYGFAVLDTTSLTIKSHDPWADIDNKFYERVVAFKAKGIKVLLAIGGWNDSAGSKYSRLVNSSASRRRFITHVLQFIEKYKFDGLDLDWEYPVCWQVDCKRGPSSDKRGFSMLVKELSAEFRPKGLLLSSAVSPNKRVIDEGYDVPLLAEYLDWIAVMAYDYHGQWDKKTGHVAPLYVHPEDWETTFNANFTMHYWLEKGAAPKKLVMGAPLYGQSFSLAERSETGLNAPTYGGGEAGESTRARGFLSYYEICERVLKRGWTVVQDPKRRIGPYAYKGDQWVSFDDVEQITRKAQFIKDLGLGGGMVWAMDLDDFKNRCGCEPSPLLRTMNRVLRNYPTGSTCSITGSSIIAPAPTTSTQKPTKPSKPETTPQPTYLPPVQTTPDTEDAGSPPASITPAGDCAGRMFTPHKKDCTKYFLCNFGQLSEQTCPGGLYWNKDRCDWPENSDCANKLEQMDQIVPGKPELPTTPEKPCISSNLWTIDDGSHLKNKKLICYFTNWAWYRPGIGKYLPEDIDPNHCTHVVYGFTVLDADQLIMKIHDSWTDIDNDFYGKITALKAKGIKVLIALGGWNDSTEDKLKNSRLMNNPTARKNFIMHALEFIDKYGFDGLDLDWEYPVCWHVDCNRGLSSDKEAFASLVKELSIKFKPRGLLLSSVVSSSKRVIDLGYDVPTLAKYLDWIAVMTYDFHGHWEHKTGHVAPLFYYPGDEFDYFNANFSMNYWIEKGAPPSSLVMGIPLYGQSFTLQNTTIRNLQAETSGPGRAGEFTRAAGFLAFYEICDKVKNGGWTVTKDPLGRVGPFATKGDQWVGYDDVTNVVKKATLIRDLNLGGGMVWALDLDDFKNICGCGKYPLLTTLSRVLSGEQVYSRDCI